MLFGDPAHARNLAHPRRFEGVEQGLHLSDMDPGDLVDQLGKALTRKALKRHRRHTPALGAHGARHFEGEPSLSRDNAEGSLRNGGHA